MYPPVHFLPYHSLFRRGENQDSFQPDGRFIDTNGVKRSSSISVLNPFQRHSGIPERLLLTREAEQDMRLGNIPDLYKLCHELNQVFKQSVFPFSATAFIPVLKKLESIHPAQERRFLQNPVTNHVLVENDDMKTVLIHWKPGKFSSIHGHPAGGCLFKVLKGSLVEKRFTPDAEEEFMAMSTFSKGSMAYIDDDMAYHSVGNPFDSSAISIHIYSR